MKRLFLFAVAACFALTLGSCSNKLYQVYEVTRTFTASQTGTTGEGTEQITSQILRAKVLNEAMEWRESCTQPYSAHSIKCLTNYKSDGTYTINAFCEMSIWDLRNVRPANKKSNKRK